MYKYRVPKRPFELFTGFQWPSYIPRKSVPRTKRTDATWFSLVHLNYNVHLPFSVNDRNLTNTLQSDDIQLSLKWIRPLINRKPYAVTTHSRSHNGCSTCRFVDGVPSGADLRRLRVGCVQLSFVDMSRFQLRPKKEEFWH